MNDEQKKDYESRANLALSEINVILEKYELTISSVMQYLPTGMVGKCELVNTKKLEPAIITPSNEILTP